MDINSNNFSKKERRVLRREERRQEQMSYHQKNKIKKYLYWAGGILALAVLTGLVIWSASLKDETAVANVEGITADDWVKGNPEAKITLIEYSDFQCPACGNYYPIVKALAEEFKDDVAIAYRHFPLYRIHPKAEPAAIATEAAGRQGKFWEMHDIIFENQNIWANSGGIDELFSGYAKDIGLDIEKFAADVKDSILKEKISAQYQGGIGVGVNSTPTFFLNGEHLNNPRSLDDFRAILAEAINNANAL